MLRSLSLIREYLLNLVRVSSIVAKLYSTFILIYCEVIVKRRSAYDALTLLCNAQRRILDLNITNKCRNLIEHIIQSKSCKDGKLLPIEQNNLLHTFYKSRRFRKAKQIFKDEKGIDKLRLRHFRENSNPARQGNIIILKKPNSSDGEKGVIVLKYTSTFEQFPTIFDLNSILKIFRIVFEPSSYRNIESSLFLYSGLGLKHILQAAQNDDNIVLSKLTSSISTIDLGSGDWIDFKTFSPTDTEKLYDVVFVASWAKIKRHEVLFDSLSQLKGKGKKLMVALVGYPQDMKKEDILKKAKKYGVNEHCDIFDQIQPKEVARIISSSKLAVHLSKAEGTNKASYEAWMCNVPLIVYKYNVGFRNNYVNEYTGMLADDSELADAMDYVLTHESHFSPREWIFQYSGYLNSTNKLNKALKEIALELGEPWTIDIVPKKNEPNLLYAHDGDRIALETAYFDLEQYMLTS